MKTPRTVVLQVDAQCSAEEAYALWSTTEGVKQFFAPAARIDARPAGEYTILFYPEKDPEGLSHGTKGARVLATVPGKLFAFEWITFAGDATLGRNAPTLAPRSLRDCHAASHLGRARVCASSRRFAGHKRAADALRIQGRHVMGGIASMVFARLGGSAGADETILREQPMILAAAYSYSCLYRPPSLRSVREPFRRQDAQHRRHFVLQNNQLFSYTGRRRQSVLSRQLCGRRRVIRGDRHERSDASLRPGTIRLWL